MTIEKQAEGQSLTLKLAGRLDTMTAPELEDALRNSLEGVQSLTLDFSGLEYLSSAGLRVLLAAQKRMNQQGAMVVKNVCADIQEIFEMTGFSDILTVE